MGPKKDNNKSAKSSDKSVNKPKGKNAKKTSDTKTIDKPKEKVKQQKINFVVTPKTTITTSTTATVTNNSSFSTAVNAQDIITTCSTPPQKRNVDPDSPFSTSSQVFKSVRKQRQDSARKTIESTHRGDDSNFNEISSDQVENVRKTTVNPHRGIDVRFSTKTLSKRKGVFSIVNADIHQENLTERCKRKKVFSDDSSDQNKVSVKKQRQDSARKTIESTHRGDDSNFNEIIPCDQDPVGSVEKTGVTPHRRKVTKTLSVTQTRYRGRAKLKDSVVESSTNVDKVSNRGKGTRGRGRGRGDLRIGGEGQPEGYQLLKCSRREDLSVILCIST